MSRIFGSIKIIKPSIVNILKSKGAMYSKISSTLVQYYLYYALEETKKYTIKLLFMASPRAPILPTIFSPPPDDRDILLFYRKKETYLKAVNKPKNKIIS